MLRPNAEFKPIAEAATRAHSQARDLHDLIARAPPTGTRIAVIGTGISGVQAMKGCLAEGIEPVAFEASGLQLVGCLLPAASCLRLISWPHDGRDAQAMDGAVAASLCKPSQAAHVASDVGSGGLRPRRLLAFQGARTAPECVRGTLWPRTEWAVGDSPGCTARGPWVGERAVGRRPVAPDAAGALDSGVAPNCGGAAVLWLCPRYRSTHIDTDRDMNSFGDYPWGADRPLLIHNSELTRSVMVWRLV